MLIGIEFNLSSHTTMAFRVVELDSYDERAARDRLIDYIQSTYSDVEIINKCTFLSKEDTAVRIEALSSKGYTLANLMLPPNQP